MPLTSVFLFLQHWWPSSKGPTDKIDKGPVHKIDKGAADTSKCLNLTTPAVSRDLDTNCRLSSFPSAPNQIHQMSHFQQIQVCFQLTTMPTFIFKGLNIFVVWQILQVCSIIHHDKFSFSFKLKHLLFILHHFTHFCFV